jgi:hypothetical protein
MTWGGAVCWWLSADIPLRWLAVTRVYKDRPGSGESRPRGKQRPRLGERRGSSILPTLP